ncbi:MAG: hypothetical protein ACLFOY_04515 [Desulfatibacillaceae bacterium]
MSRSIAILCVAAILATPSAAMAYFSPVGNSLVRVVYYGNEMEIATDLGDITTLSHGRLGSAGDFSLSDFSSTDDWADLQVGYFGAINMTVGGTYEFYFTTRSDEVPDVNANQKTAYQSCVMGVRNYYSSLGATDTVQANPVDPYSYNTKMNQNRTTEGTFAGYQPVNGEGEANMADLATKGYVDLYLWHFLNDACVGGQPMGILRTHADGGTTYMAYTVPLPDVTMADIIGILQVTANLAPGGIGTDNQDYTEDGKVGLEDAHYGMQIFGGLR